VYCVTEYTICSFVPALWGMRTMKTLRQDDQSVSRCGPPDYEAKYQPLNCRVLFRPVNVLFISNTHECRSKKKKKKQKEKGE